MGLVLQRHEDDSDEDWSDIAMLPNEKRESAQIIQFPLNRRFEPRRQDMTQVIDPRIAAALDPAWYHMEAMDESKPPKH
ncbi:MAG: DUF2735 domain-containing protein [Hyphomicrobiales bacterium]|nr:MAG: DUF2735 domain-containing protein [Hyphomicrobiales bacterium]